MPNSYPRDGIFNTHITTINDSYIVFLSRWMLNLIAPAPENIHIVFDFIAKQFEESKSSEEN